jgi:hypothetical protein
MRLRLLVLLTAAGMLGGAFCVQACGASDDPAVEQPDAGEGGPRESGTPDVSEPEPPCDRTADLFARVHDASIGDGASTTGVCIGCAKARCDEAIAKCTADCPCQGIVGRALECYLTTQQLGCASELTNYLVTSETRSNALRILGCVQSECPVECVVDGGVEAGPTDGGTDADAG